MKSGGEAATRVLGELWPTTRRNTQGETDSETEEERDKMNRIYGAVKKDKDPKHVRIGISNLGGFPNDDTVQMTEFKKWATSEEMDCLMLQEFNKNWSLVQADQRPKEKIRHWWKQTVSNVSWMKVPREEATLRQYGGTGVISNDRIACTVCKNGQDSENMGRWAWTSFRGKNNSITTVISIYYPQKGVESSQMAQLARKYRGERREPLKEFRRDLKCLIKEKLEKDHNIIVAGDMNNSMIKQSDPLSKMLMDLGLREVLTEKYGKENAPPTQNRGSEPIDGVWATGGINIVQGGYDQWNDFSDHRTLWVDIHEKVFLGRGLEPIVKPKARRLQLENPKTTRRFEELVTESMERKNLDERAIAIDTAIALGADLLGNTDLQEEYENIYRDRDNSHKYADARCRKIKGVNLPYSPTLAKAMGEVVVYEMILKRHNYRGRKGRPHVKLIKRKARRWKFNIEYSVWNQMSKDEVVEKLKEARKQFRKLKPKAKELRTGYLETLADAIHEEKGGDRDKHFENLQKREKRKDSDQRIKIAQGKSTGGLCCQVEKENEDGTRTLVTDEEGIVDECITANTEKLQQANNTDLRMEPLCSYFGENCDYDKWESILHGKLPIPTEWDVDEGTRLVMEKLSEGPGEEVEIDWSPEAYYESWKKMKEHTVSAPGSHFGHFKAASKDSVANSVNTILAKIPMKTGYSPISWRKCVNSMIVKKINDIRAAKLRLIALLDAQFNHNNKLVGKIMMMVGEKNGSLAPEQYGSRKKKNSRTHALNKRLVLDIAIQRKRPMLLIANDAKSCYDRIILMIAYLIMRKYGMPIFVAICLIDCIARLEHCIRTIFGDSSRKYGGKNWHRCPHGNCQGNGTGPCLWACISTILLDIMRDRGFGMQFTSIITAASLLLVGFSFVDDTDLIQDGDTMDEAFQKAQEGLDLWESILRATGGAIEPTKSDWVGIDYKWNQGKWSFVRKDPNRKLMVRGPDGTRKALKQLNFNEARETLGVMQAANGQDKTQFEHLQKKVKRWSTSMQIHTIPAEDISKAIKTTITKTVEYGLVATSMSEAQCKKLADPIVEKVMPKMKLCRNMKRDVVEGDESILGVGIPNFHVLQTSEKIQALLDHGGRNSHTGTLLTNTIELALLELGIGGQLFNQDLEIPSKLVDGIWLSDLLKCMQKYDIKVQSKHAELTLWRKNDVFIMDEILSNRRGTGGFTEKEIESINRCRKYLNVLTLSDITNGNGIIIERWAIDCKKPGQMTHLSATKYKWPPQGKPSAKDRSIWKDAIINMFGTGRSGLLHNPLGPWTSTAKDESNWRYCQHSKRLFSKETNGNWHYWTAVHSSTRRKPYVNMGLAPDTWVESAVCIPRVIIQSKRTCNFRGYDKVDMSITNTIYDDIVEELTRDPKYGWGIADITLHKTVQEIADMIEQGKAFAGTDGSTVEERSSGGFLLFDENDNDMLSGGNWVPGRPEDQNSYRAELGGILGMVLTANLICQKANKSGTITVCCDSDSALDNAFSKRFPTCNMPSYDILRLIQKAVEESPITWIKRKVQGHQDRNKKYEELDMWGKANCRADSLAGEYMQRHPGSVKKEFPYDNWTLLLDGSPICSGIKKAIYTHCTEPKVKQYWAEKNYFGPNNHSEEISWQTFKTAAKEITGPKRRWLTKHLAHDSATGKVMLRRGERTGGNDKCPLCKYEVEDTDHIIKCQSYEAEVTYTKGVEKMRKWLDQTTEPRVRKMVIEMINSLREDRPFEIDPRWQDDIIDLAREQLEYGRRAMVHGFLTHGWEQWHKDYSDEISSKLSPKRWVVQLILKMWDISWDMWINRCDVSNSADEHRAILLSAENIDDEIKEFYNDLPPRRLMNDSERRAFKIPMDDFLKLPLKSKVRLLRRNRVILDSYEAQPEIMRSSSIMRNFLRGRNASGQPLDNNTNDTRNITNDDESSDETVDLTKVTNDELD